MQHVAGHVKAPGLISKTLQCGGGKTQAFGNDDTDTRVHFSGIFRNNGLQASPTSLPSLAAAVQFCIL